MTYVKKYSFPYILNQKVSFGDLNGKVSYIDIESEYGVEASFIDEKGKEVVCYFNKEGRHRGQDSSFKLNVVYK